MYEKKIVLSVVMFFPAYCYQDSCKKAASLIFFAQKIQKCSFPTTVAPWFDVDIE